MDTNEVDTLRATLRGLAWKDLQEVAHSAGLSPSTVDKIRRGLSKEPGVFKIQALQQALKSRGVEAA